MKMDKPNDILLLECLKLVPDEEQALAEEGMETVVESWPEY